MSEQFVALKNHKDQGNQKDFNRVLSELMPKLERYIKHRIKVFEAKRKLPKNFYAPADVLADVYLKIYEDFDQIKDEKQLKVKMFSLADEIIQSYVDKENKIKKKLPVDKLVKEELKMLYEELTVDADGELLLVSDLKDEDIEYQQDDFKPKVYIFDYDVQNAFAETLGLTADDFRDEKLRSVFGSIYAQLPETIRRVLDLNALGGLSSGEIAEITGIKPGEVDEILVAVKEKLKNRQ